MSVGYNTFYPAITHNNTIDLLRNYKVSLQMPQIRLNRRPKRFLRLRYLSATILKRLMKLMMLYALLLLSDKTSHPCMFAAIHISWRLVYAFILYFARGLLYKANRFPVILALIVKSRYSLYVPAEAVAFPKTND